MTRDCGAWINLLAHQVKKRMNATLSDLGITGVQSRVMHYILAVSYTHLATIRHRTGWPPVPPGRPLIYEGTPL